MKFWEDMRSKWGFSDGETIPPDAFELREVYVKTLNVLLAKHNSGVRAICYDTSGFHNIVLVFLVPVSLWQSFTSGQVLGNEYAEIPNDEPSLDEGYEKAFDEAVELYMDDYVECIASIKPEFEVLLNKLPSTASPLID